MGQWMEMTAKGGDPIKLDISDAACMQFGFKHGQRIIDPRGDKGVAMGVAPTRAGEHGLWFAFDDDEGEVCYWGVNVDLEEEGFKRIDLTTEEVLDEMVVCFRVIASTNGKTESVIVRDVAVAAAQGRVFKQAGHRDFFVNPVMVLFDKWGTKGDVFGDEFIETAEVHRVPIPSRYQRADLYPKITVRDYDRDVLKRRVTGAQVIVAVIVITALCVGAAALGLASVIILSKLFNPIFAGIWLLAIVGGLLLRKKGPSLIDQIANCGMRAAGIEEWGR